MKGVSQVIGSALLLGIGVSVAGVYSTFAGDFAQSSGEQISDQTRSDIKCNSASVDIRDLRYTATSAARFTIVNTGTVDLRGVSTIAINETADIVNSTEVERLGVSESNSVALQARTKPEFVTAAVDECPGIRPREEF